MEIVAMACVTLAAKIEEDARRIRDVINVFHHVKQVRSGKYVVIDSRDKGDSWMHPTDDSF
jgi:cyclin L